MTVAEMNAHATSSPKHINFATWTDITSMFMHKCFRLFILPKAITLIPNGHNVNIIIYYETNLSGIFYNPAE